MKSLREHIYEAFEKFTINKKWLYEKYDYFNKIYFDNELPFSGDIDLYIKPIPGNALGHQGFYNSFYYNKLQIKDGKYIMKYVDKSGIINIVSNIVTQLLPYIGLSSRYDATENQWEDTLIHEMIHLYTYKEGLSPKQAHGPEFRKKCNEIRKIAKDKYGKDYELEIYAKRNDDYQLTQEEQNKIIKKNQRKMSNTSGIYFELATTWYPKRFTFVSKNNLPNIFKYITKYEKELRSIYVTDDSYEKMCNTYGRFPVSRTYRFFNATEFPKAMEYMMKGENLIDVNEAKKEYIKPMMNVIEIDKTVNLSNVNLEDILNEIEKFNSENDIEIKGDANIEKHIIDGDEKHY